MYRPSICHMDGDKFAVLPEPLQHGLEKLMGLLLPLTRLSRPSQACRHIREHLHLDGQVCAEVWRLDRAAFIEDGCVIPAGLVAVAILGQAILIGVAVAEV